MQESTSEGFSGKYYMHAPSGVARGGPSRARPDQLCCSELYYLYTSTVVHLWSLQMDDLFLIEGAIIFLKNKKKTAKTVHIVVQQATR